MSDMDMDRHLRCKIADLTEECKTLRSQLAHWKVFGEHAEGERSKELARRRELEGRLAVQADAPIGYLTRFKSQVADAEECFPGEPHDHLWSYTHGTKKMEHFAAFPDIEVVPVYAIPKPAKGLTVQADADGVWLAFAASTGLHALLHVERIADSHGGIVSKALRDWAADVGRPRGA